MVTLTSSASPPVPQENTVPPVVPATSEDLRLFLEYVEKAISDKMNRQSPAVQELLLEGYGDITVSLKVQRGRLVVANVHVGTQYKLDKDQGRNPIDRRD